MIKELLRIFSSKARSGQKVKLLAAVYIRNRSVQLLISDAYSGQVQRTFSVPLNEQHDLIPALVKLCQDIPPQTPVCLVLSPERYQIVQLDKPKLAEHEMLQGLPWLLRDLVQIPVEDILLDYIDIPDTKLQTQPRIQVVVTSISALRPVCRELELRKVAIKSIVPEEWLSRYLFSQAQGGVMLVSQQPEQEVNVQIVQDSVLYFTRKLRGFNRIDQYSESELREGMLDNLLLELQRSMDFYESQFRQLPVRSIFFALPTPNQDFMIQYFNQAGFNQVQALDLGDWMPAATSSFESYLNWVPIAGALTLKDNGERKHEANR